MHGAVFLYHAYYLVPLASSTGYKSISIFAHYGRIRSVRPFCHWAYLFITGAARAPHDKLRAAVSQRQHEHEDRGEAMQREG